jgi:hypothetical protein
VHYPPPMFLTRYVPPLAIVLAVAACGGKIETVGGGNGSSSSSSSSSSSGDVGGVGFGVPVSPVPTPTDPAPSRNEPGGQTNPFPYAADDPETTEPKLPTVGVPAYAWTIFTSTSDFVVPPDCFKIAVKAWGAGGGGAGAKTVAHGGAGGFAFGQFLVTPGESLTVIVGGAGAASGTVGREHSAEGGGGPSFGLPQSGLGGGRSALGNAERGEILTAGGGGGAGGREATAHGGGGGGKLGLNAPGTFIESIGDICGTGGGVKHVSGCATMKQFVGGNSCGGSGGSGGGGYYGGDGCQGGHGGGGGSSFVPPGGVTLGSENAYPRYRSDSSYQAGIGVGGAGIKSGGGGLVAIVCR